MRLARKDAWLIVVLLLPLFSMAVIPFYDTSEPRYAEIARVMARSGDWITPWFSPDLPFWGKPPLSFWAQALSMKAFGINEFAARFPSWLCWLLSNALLFAGARSLYGRRVALLAATVYSTGTLVYIGSGAVLTDPFLAFGTTLSLVSFAIAVKDRKPVFAGAGEPQEKFAGASGAPGSWWWRYGFFAGLAIGLLAKGPLAVVIGMAPVLVWHMCNHKTSALATALPWATGLALTAVLSLPWYILAELKTPGFLDYFIVGEHWLRFLDPGWSGDLYGTAHRQPYGMIWLYWLMASFPWGVLMLALLMGSLRSSRLRSALRATSSRPLSGYWLAGALFTPIFFTFAANILWTYLFPAMAGFSILVAIFLDRMDGLPGFSRRMQLTIAGIVPVALLGLSVIAWVSPDLYLRSTERGLVRYVMQQGEPVSSLHYYGKPPFSARFYSAGQAREMTQGKLRQATASCAPFYLAIPKDQQKAVAETLGRPLDPLYVNKRYVLVRISTGGADLRQGCLKGLL